MNHTLDEQCNWGERTRDVEHLEALTVQITSSALYVALVLSTVGQLSNVFF